MAEASEYAIIKLSETLSPAPRPISESLSQEPFLFLTFSPGLMSDSSHGAHITSLSLALFLPLVPSFEFLSKIFTLCRRHGRRIYYAVPNLASRLRPLRSRAAVASEFTRRYKWRCGAGFTVRVSPSFLSPSAFADDSSEFQRGIRDRY